MGLRGPPKKPTGLRQAGRRTSIPHPEPPPARPACPAWLSKDAKVEWRRVVPLLEALGLLTNMDRAVLANYCESWAEWVQYAAQVRQYGAVLPIKRKDGSTELVQSPYVKLAEAARDRMMRAAVQFGFSPSSRSNIRATPGAVRRPPIAPVVTVEDQRSVLRVLESGG